MNKYKPEYAEQLVQHFNKEAYEPLIHPETGEYVLSARGKVVLTPCKFPTFSSFACAIGIASGTVYRWGNDKYPDHHAKAGEYKHPEFHEAYKLARDHQERILVQGGIAGAFQGNFAIFTAKNLLGWKDKVEHAHSGTMEHKLGLSDALKAMLTEMIKNGS